MIANRRGDFLLSIAYFDTLIDTLVSEHGANPTRIYMTGGSNAGMMTFVEDSEGGHGWPGSRARREGNAPISSFSGAERVWAFFKDKQRLPNSARPADIQSNP